MTPASSGDHAMKVSLFLQAYQRELGAPLKTRHEPLALARGESVFEIVYGISRALADSALAACSWQPYLGVFATGPTYALGLRCGVDQLVAECLPVLVARVLLDDDLLVVVGQLEDDVFVLLGELQVVVCRYALLG